MTINRQWLVDASPRGRALELTDFKYNEAEVVPLGKGEVRVKVECLSFEPSQKGQIEVIAGYSSGTAIGDVMGARGIGEVVESNDPGLAIGKKVLGSFGWQELATLPGRSLQELPNDQFLVFAIL